MIAVALRGECSNIGKYIQSRVMPSLPFFCLSTVLIRGP
jgi:hypothetical protein